MTMTFAELAERAAMTVMVRPGDTLYGLAQKHLGDGNKWPRLWRINAEVIIQEQRRYPQARRHMRGPDWIFNGTLLRIPAQ